MRKFKNVITGAILTESELESLHLREYKEMWEDPYPTSEVQEFKEQGKELDEFIEIMKIYDVDTDFQEIV